MIRLRMLKLRNIFLLCITMFIVSITFQAEVVSAKAAVPKASVKKVKKGTTVKAGDLKYKVTSVSPHKKTVAVTGVAKKSLTRVVVPAKIKIKSRKGKYKGTYSYKVTAINARAFQKNKKIKSVKLGSNVVTVGSRAFYSCKSLQKVTLGKATEKIGSYAFANCKKLKKLVIPNKVRLKSVAKTAFKGTKIKYSAKTQSAAQKSAADYKYEIIPMLSPFNEYFFIKTDNPDPGSFRFLDVSSIYKGESGDACTITPIQKLFADVVYENKKTFRVIGGYLASGSYTDGGVLKLQSAKVTNSYPCYNLTTGETTTEYSYDYKDTNVEIKLGTLVDETDYLIQKYAGNSTDFFSKMDAIESGFGSICLYSNVYVKGTLKKSDGKWGISTSPHADQSFYIQDPYYSANDSEAMFISMLYPFQYDSLGFPGMMGGIAKRLNPKASYTWTDTHYLIEVSLNGKTKTYGGAGSGGGQGIRKSDIKYYYKFDGSSSDQANDKSLTSLKNKICEYGKLNIPKDKKEGEITWDSILQKVGEGSYVKVVLLTSIFGGSGTGFSYLYDQGGSWPGYISNSWYDGRYFNKWEYFYPGAVFEETVETEQPSLVFKDFTLKLPEDGRNYLYWYDEIGTDIYDPATGVWKGYTTFSYDAATESWKADLLDRIAYYSSDDQNYHDIDDLDFINSCTITMDQACTMNLDYNTNADPLRYYVYDMEEEPGTFHTGS